MTTSLDNVEVYTIGHSNVAVDKIVQLLQRYEIQVLVDVRSIPYSQHSPQFNRDNLADAMRESGIEYLFAGEYLGGRPKDRRLYKSSENPSSREEYLEFVDYDEAARQDWYRNAIARLVEIAGERRTAIMCSEEDPKQCHRYHLIGRSLVQMGVTVWHIRKKGGVERQVDLSVFQGEKPE
jgi:uncharacterized protein (DUF488 family)